MKTRTLFIALLLTAVCLSACKQQGMIYPGETSDVTEAVPVETEAKVYYDDAVPDDFDPNADYIYIVNPIFYDTEIGLLRVNPYSCRTTALCADPLCLHDSYDCLMSSLTQPFVMQDNILYGNGNIIEMVQGYDGYVGAYVDMIGRANCCVYEYDITAGKRKMLVDTGERTFIGDIKVYEDYIYYTLRADEGYEDCEDEAFLQYRICLYRMNRQTYKIEELGPYTQRSELMIHNGRILCVFYGNDFYSLDLNNQNPEPIEKRDISEMCTGDYGGYVQRFSSAPYLRNAAVPDNCLVYIGNQDETHVVFTEKEFADYCDGKIYYMNSVPGYKVYRSNPDGSDEELIYEINESASEMSEVELMMVYKGKYLICKTYGLNKYTGNTRYDTLPYYIRIDIETGEEAKIWGLQ